MEQVVDEATRTSRLYAQLEATEAAILGAAVALSDPPSPYEIVRAAYLAVPIEIIIRQRGRERSPPRETDAWARRLELARQTAVTRWQLRGRKLVDLTMAQRNERIYEQRLEGRALQSIGDEWGIGRERIRQICWRHDRLQSRKRQRIHLRAHAGRIRDLPGDQHRRDVWLTYGPSEDPRRDNMQPVRAS